MVQAEVDRGLVEIGPGIADLVRMRVLQQLQVGVLDDVFRLLGFQAVADKAEQVVPVPGKQQADQFIRRLGHDPAGQFRRVIGSRYNYYYKDVIRNTRSRMPMDKKNVSRSERLTSLPDGQCGEPWSPISN